MEKYNVNNINNLLLQITDNENIIYELTTNQCVFDDNKNIKSLNNCWFAFKRSKMENNCEKYKIKKGDIIRFGRITTRIKEIKINKNKNINLNKSKEYNNINNINTINNINNINNINDNNNIINDPDNSGEIKTKKTCEPKAIFSIDNINVLLKLKSNTLEEIKKENQIKLYQSTQKTRKNKICKICYMEEEPLSDFNNPLVQPCNCSGSLKYIHLNCLKHWLYTKSCTKIESNNNYSIFLVKSVECEICKTKYPDFIMHKDNLYELLDFKSEFDNYFTIESLTIDKNNNRCIYVVNLDNNLRIKIGRGHDAHLTLSDISVSRIHSIITIDNKNIYLEDNNSKFGTLVLVQSPTIKIIENLPLYIQIGRTFMNCRIVQANHNIFSCCEAREKPNYNYYYDQNEKQKQKSLLNMFTIKTELDFSEDYDNDEKDFNKINLDNIEEETKNRNNRYDEMTLDIDNNNDNDVGINLINKKSLLNNEENKNDNIENNENNKEESKNIINKSESIFLESEGEII